MTRLLKIFISSKHSQSIMKESFQRIWELALPYQDKRDDAGHAMIVTENALELQKIEEANEDIVVPAAILHDIGWSQMPKNEVMKLFSPLTTDSEILHLRLMHQHLGAHLAKKILADVSYPQNLTYQIVEIITEHDTRTSFLSLEDNVVRDADKLWRFSKQGFWCDVLRMSLPPKDILKNLENKIEQLGFLSLQSSKAIALQEAKQRKREIHMKGL